MNAWLNGRGGKGPRELHMLGSSINNRPSKHDPAPNANVQNSTVSRLIDIQRKSSLAPPWHGRRVGGYDGVLIGSTSFKKTGPDMFDSPSCIHAALVVVLAILTSPATASERQRPNVPVPNVLVIVADDLGYGDVGFQGGCEVETPHLDTLATQSVRFSSAYVSAPYCSPSRAGFLTGICQTRFGHEFNPHVGDEAKLGLPLDRFTIANYFQDAGYATALFGKWHQGFSPAHHPLERGFDQYVGFLVGGHNFILHADAKPRFGTAHSHDMIYRNRELQKIDGYTTDLFTDATIEFCSPENAKPWFAYLAYNAVHTPLEILDKHRLRLPPEVKDPRRVGYLSLLLGLDDAIGRLIHHLATTKQLDNTVIVFFSDNGGAGHAPYFAYNTGNNRPLRGDKGQVLEGGIRVPFLISWPKRFGKDRQFAEPVSAIDILPTVCDLAGISVKENIEGVNLSPHMLGQMDSAPHEYLCWRFGPQRAIRQGKWKLVDWRDFDTQSQSGWELYDLEADVGESRNLADVEPKLVKELADKWNHWNESNIAPVWRGTPKEDPGGVKLKQ